MDEPCADLGAEINIICSKAKISNFGSCGRGRYKYQNLFASITIFKIDIFHVFILNSGFMTENEKKLFEAVPANEFNTYWVPCTWFISRLQEAAKHGKLLNQYALESIMRVSEECFIFYFTK